MKKIIKVALKSVAIVTVIYAVWNTMVHVWVSSSRIARQMRLRKKAGLYDNCGFSENAYEVNTAVLDEAKQEFKLFKKEVLGL